MKLIVKKQLQFFESDVLNSFVGWFVHNDWS